VGITPGQSVAALLAIGAVTFALFRRLPGVSSLLRPSRALP
jgi:hypothetical protein